MFALQQVKNSTEEGECIFSVAELNNATRDLLEGHFQDIWVQGEISNLSQPSSGHIYFSLKDGQAQVRCAWFRGKQGPQRFQIDNGQLMLVRARVTLYPERGDFQLVVEKVTLAGLGLLQQQLEALKRKLHAQGWFDERHKKKLPMYPQCVGIISSASGAALQDVLSVLKRRAPFIKIFVYSCFVQGNDAPKSIIRALTRADAEAKCDVLLLTRGGGSLEDLWAFNNEALAQAIFTCKTPIVSAIGHEIDFSISDFVADVRAATPSAAAELVSPDLSNLLVLLQKKDTHLTFLIRRVLENYSYGVDQLAYSLKHPAEILAKQKFKLDLLYESLKRLIHREVVVKNNRLQLVKYALDKKILRAKIIQRQAYLLQYKQQLLAAIKKSILAKTNAFLLQIEKLETLSPIKVLQRGYALVYDKKNSVIDSVDAVAVEEKILVRLIDGALVCQVQDKE